MFISKKWLQEYVYLPDSLSGEELGHDVTMHTVEVEEVIDRAKILEHVFVGVVVAIEKHPNADKLSVCQVDIGNEQVQVVCGGSNLQKGMKVALGKAGARVRWHGQGELVDLQKTTIRGVESYGMICASDEIGLAETYPKKDEREIVDLSDIKAKPGTPLFQALEINDVIIEIDNKSLSSRPDLWGHYGMAREVAAIYHKELKSYNPSAIKPGEGMMLEAVVEDQKLCPRYMAVAVDGIVIEDSPLWLREKLQTVGIRPINVVVDVTNYVMMDVGQPMHAFDVGRLRTSDFGLRTTIVVRPAKNGEKIIALDGKEYELTNDMLVIADAEKSIALAGVIGGEESSVTEQTKSVIFECANFDPVSVRKTASRLGIRTDSSARFEKSLDPTVCEKALARAVELVLELVPGAKVVSRVVDEKAYTLNQEPIDVSLEFLQKKVGVALSKKDVTSILERLGFGVKDRRVKRPVARHAASEKDSILSISVPTWRATKDISIPEDIVEEVARMYGYANIPVALPLFPITPPPVNYLRNTERKIREILAFEHGYTEVYSYSFVSPKYLHTLGITDVDMYIELDRPIAKDRPLVRRNMFPNLLEFAQKNLHTQTAVKLFETGRTFLKDEPGERAEPNSDELLPRQDTALGMVYAQKGNEQPFFELSQAIAGIFYRLNILYELYAVEGQDIPSFVHPGRYAKILVEGIEVGRIAEIHPHIQENIGIPYRTAIVEMNINELVPFVISSKSSYQPLAQYPLVVRDIAFTVNRDVTHSDAEHTMQSVDPLVVGVELFDIYEGKGMGKGKKSMAYHITYRSDERTLTTQEVDTVHAQVVKALEKRFHAEMRK